MRLSRRHLLVAGVAIPGVALAGRASTELAGALAGAIRAVRPGVDGTSATRCAQCGSPEHTMLDPRCPLAPRVRA